MNEDGQTVPTVVGRRYLCGSFILEEYSDSLQAATRFWDIADVEEEVKRG